MQPFTLFLPVYNEAELLVPNTERLQQYLVALGTPYEILIGSNGSTDGTVRLGEELQRRHPHVRFFHLPQRGPGLAFRRAVELMRYDVLVCLDMDLSVDIRVIPEFVRQLDDAEIVLGSKKMGVESRSIVRRLGSDLFIWCSQRLLGLPFDDYSIGAKAYRKTVLQRYWAMIDPWTFYVQRLAYHAVRDGLRVVQIPVQCQDFRRSRFNLVHEGSYRFWGLFRLRLSSRYRPDDRDHRSRA